ncbi:MAG: inositol monophosphatase family protein [Actinomycetota bacterium]
MTGRLESELAFAGALADLAASISLPRAGSDLDVRNKADATPVSEVDIEVERALRRAVAERYPDDGFVGEEDGLGPGGPRVWTVDPIDGTRNFLDGLPMWATLIALVIDGHPVLGLVDAPALSERYAAVEGRGATLDGEPIRASDRAALGDAFVLHSGVEEWLGDDRWSGFARIASASRRTRGISDAWGHMLVARGSADAMLEHDPCGIWDWAAVAVVLGEAGGRLTTLDGSALHDGCDLLSSNGRLHAALLGEISVGASAEGSGSLSPTA